MNEKKRAERDVSAAGFILLHYAPTGSTWFRWLDDGSREEIALLFDGRRLAAWSVWDNTRMKPPDQEPGRRERLQAWLKETS